MGRHSTKARRRRSWIFAGAAVAVLVLALGVAWYQDALDTILPPNAWARHCTPTQLSVIADTTIAPALTKSAATFDAVTPCVKTTVRAQNSADTAALLAVGGDAKADVWVPDSPAWESRIQVMAWSLIRPAPEMQFGAAIATTPLVFAAPVRETAALANTKLDWNSVADGSVNALLPEPAQNGPSLAALAAIKQSLSSSDQLAFSRAMIALGKNIPSSDAAAFADAQNAQNTSGSTVAITTEQAVVAQNAASPSSQFFAVYPNSGTVSVSYPFVRLDASTADASTAADSTSADSTRGRLVSALEHQFASNSKPFARAGFRTASGAGDFSATGVVAAAPKAEPALDGGAQVGILQSWSSITVRSRMLVVIDVSGSMLDDAGGGLTRIGVFQQAAPGVVSMFSPQSELGIWEFSTNQVGTQPWKPLSPVAPIGDPAHAADIANIIATLPSQVQGDTGLYDTTLAAVKQMQATYDPKMINSVLVITDGVNDDPGGLALPSLLTQLKATHSADKPVPVIMVGLGPEIDLGVMSQIAAATVGSAYSAMKPQDLGNVLVDALSQRTCRPYCS
ncbi:VWA domain-containing protein [Rathayibacter soli]|uniref:VWA domain-containing protein n=1 Tax=Rathayibacter soli TaxID=3144168 RepID=UPI0027E405CF|nr:VWA domain-containing protein [Glaciibacter superstes]